MGHRAGAAAATGFDAVREACAAVAARRRARAQRHAAHARYVAHVDATAAPPTGDPRPEVEARLGVVPAPPPPPWVESHEATATVDPAFGPVVDESLVGGADAPGTHRVPLVQQRESMPTTRRRDRRHGRGPTSPRPPIVVPPRPALQPGPDAAGAATRRRRRQAGGEPLNPPLHIRVRSALLMMTMMAFLGLVAASLVLAVVFVVVEALSGL